ncbi:hypothetical protein GpartN1_g291.t1 [Galdieria partita]|uniref:Uncharacterized protein n=1 Tax=Galdieria partita TaxID=83374 RepID=A0A9C7UM96_9RHOD|nr:hypothetical protein GpartN1_g291.t1 [Galdieria partita]
MAAQKQHKKRLSFEVLPETSSCDHITERISHSAPGHLCGKKNKARKIFYYKDGNMAKGEPQKEITPVKKLNFPYSRHIQTKEKTLSVTTCENHQQTVYERKGNKSKKKLIKPGLLERLDNLLVLVNSDSQIYHKYENNSASVFSHLTKHVRVSSEIFTVNNWVYTYPTHALISCCSVVEDNQVDLAQSVLLFLPCEVYRSIPQYFRLLWPYFETTKNVHSEGKHSCQRILVASHVVPVRV